MLNLSELRRIADTLEQTHNRGPEWSEDLHSAHIIRAEALAYGTSPFHEPSHSEPEETPPEDIRTEESLATQANDAKTAMRELTEPMLRKYDESLPTDVSPSIAAVPELAKKLREAITPPAGALIGFHITGPHSGDTVGLPDGPKNNDHPATTIIHISIVYRARKVIKSLVDPYPKGYPAILAAAHAAVASRMLQEAIDSEIDNPASRDQRTLGRMIHTLEQAIRTNLHDVTGSQIRHVLETAAKHGCPPAAQASMLSAATLEDQDLADTLAGNKSGAWRRTARQDQAQAVIDAGKNAGLDEYALDDLAWTMGFQGTELGVPVPKPTSDQLNAVFTATDEVDLPKRTRHMMTNAILNFHPHRARH